MKHFEETTPADWEDMMATTLDSSYFCANAAPPYLKASKGTIIDIGALGGDRRMTAFNATKGALVNFTRGLALDLGPADAR